MEQINTAWLVMLLIGSGSAVIGFLLRRAIAQHDERLRKHDDCLDEQEKAMTALKVDVAKAQGAADHMVGEMRDVKHSIREVRQGQEGMTKLMMQLLGRGQ